MMLRSLSSTRKTTRVRSLALLLAGAALLAPAHAGEGETSIGAPVSHHEGAVLYEWGAPLLRGECDTPPDAPGERDRLADAVEGLLRAEVEAAGGALYVSRGDLVISGGPDVVDLVRRRVAAIDSFVQGRATLSVAAVHVDDVADAESADTIRAAITAGRGRVVWSGRISSRRGEPIRREATVETSLVADLDVEVANAASIADPVVLTLATGWRMGLQQRPLDADRTFVALTFQLSGLESMEKIETGAGTVQRPRVGFVSVSVPLVVRRGRAEIVLVDHPFANGLLAVVVNVLSLPDVSRMPYRLVDVAAHTGVGVMNAPVAIGLDDCSTENEEVPSPYAAALTLMERIVTTDAGDEWTPSIALLRDPELVLPEPQPRGLERRSWRGVDAAQIPGYDPLDGSLSSDAVAARRLTRSSSHTALFALPGVRTRYFAGTWTRVLTEFDVEIAEKAAITDPIVYSFVAGDLWEVPADGVTPAGDVSVVWSIVRAAAPETTALVIRRDIDGKRTEENADRIDVIRHRAWSGSLLVTDDTPAEIRLHDDEAEIDLWSRD